MGTRAIPKNVLILMEPGTFCVRFLLWDEIVGETYKRRIRKQNSDIEAGMCK